jgi:hypothetical protein
VSPGMCADPTLRAEPGPYLTFLTISA